MKIVYTFLVGILGLLIGGFVIAYYYERAAEKDSTTADSSSFQTFTNKSLKFSLKYPDKWLKEQPRLLGSDSIFSIEFFDPESLREIEISECLNNESFNWVNNTPVKEDCKIILDKATQEQRETLNKKISLKKIYVNVIEPKTEEENLKVWVEERYKDPSKTETTEIKEVSIDANVGYIADIGCCADYNVAYVTIKDGLIYEIGTYYAEGMLESGRNSLLDEIVKNFEFI